MPESNYLSQVYLTINGSEAPTELMAIIDRVEVDQDLHLPGMFRLVVNDPGFDWLDSSLFDVGNEVEIAALSLDGTRAPLLVGEITALEPDFPEEGVPSLEVRGYDRLHRLQRGTRTRTFVQQTDGDIVQRIAGEYGMQADVQATSTVYEHVYQNNQSDLAFLRERAWLNGYVLRAEGNSLVYKSVRELERDPLDLEYGSTLLEFRPRLVAAAQVDQVEVRGWDYKAKRAVTAREAPSRWPNAGDASEQVAKDAFGTDSEVLVAEGRATQTSVADALAAALAVGVDEDRVRAEGLALGNPSLAAGTIIEVDAVGSRFSGAYFVTSARHRFASEDRYETEFSVSGHRAETVREILTGPGPAGAPPRTALALAVGVVSNNDDPESLGRVKVTFPALSEEHESGWARVAAPMAGPDRGLFLVPEVEDEVLVAFLDGDMDSPVVIGSLWNGSDAPPQGGAVVSGQRVEKRIFRTRAGHEVIFDDTGGSERIEVVGSSGRDRIVIDAARNTITIEAGSDVLVDSRSSVTMKTTGTLKLEGSTVEVQATGNVSIKGAMIELN